MKTGIIGLGARISWVLPMLQQAAPQIEVTAVADPGPRNNQRLSDASPEHVYETAGEMLARHKFDFLIVGSPNQFHMDQLEQALESDAPRIFTEKPVVTSIDDTIRLAGLLARHGGVERVSVGMVLRYSKLYRALRQAADDGLLGDIMSIEAAEHIGPYHGSFFMRDWRRFSDMSGGFMLEKCCHDLDLYQGVVGARAMRVASFGGRKKYIPANRPKTPPAYLEAMTPRWGGIDDAFSGEGDLIDYQTALIEYANGANLAFHTNLNVPDEYRRFSVIGTNGMAEGDFIRNYFRVTRSDDNATLIDIPEVSTNHGMKGHYGADEAMSQDLMDYYSGALAELPLNVIDALEAGVTALAMDQARLEGRIVDLAPVWDRFDAALNGGPPA